MNWNLGMRRNFLSLIRKAPGFADINMGLCIQTDHLDARYPKDVT